MEHITTFWMCKYSEADTIMDGMITYKMYLLMTLLTSTHKQQFGRQDQKWNGLSQQQITELTLFNIFAIYHITPELILGPCHPNLLHAKKLRRKTYFAYAAAFLLKQKLCDKTDQATKKRNDCNEDNKFHKSRRQNL